MAGILHANDLFELLSHDVVFLIGAMVVVSNENFFENFC
jgi:hypothetical protein